MFCFFILAGGFKDLFFSPPRESDPIWQAYWSDGLRTTFGNHKASSCSIVFVPDSSTCLHRLAGFSMFQLDMIVAPWKEYLLVVKWTIIPTI